MNQFVTDSSPERGVPKHQLRGREPFGAADPQGPALERVPNEMRVGSPRLHQPGRDDDRLQHLGQVHGR